MHEAKLEHFVKPLDSRSPGLLAMQLHHPERHRRWLPRRVLWHTMACSQTHQKNLPMLAVRAQQLLTSRAEALISRVLASSQRPQCACVETMLRA